MGVSRLWTWNENKRQSPFVKKKRTAVFFSESEVIATVHLRDWLRSISFVFFSGCCWPCLSFCSCYRVLPCFFFFYVATPSCGVHGMRTRTPSGTSGFYRIFLYPVENCICFIFYLFFLPTCWDWKKNRPRVALEFGPTAIGKSFPKSHYRVSFFFTEFLSSHNRMCCDFDKNGQLCDFFSTSYHKFEFKEDVLTCSRLEIFPLRIWISIRWNFFCVCF